MRILRVLDWIDTDLFSQVHLNPCANKPFPRISPAVFRRRNDQLVGLACRRQLLIAQSGHKLLSFL
jgi:hypothetical protein